MTKRSLKILITAIILGLLAYLLRGIAGSMVSVILSILGFVSMLGFMDSWFNED